MICVLVCSRNVSEIKFAVRYIKNIASEKSDEYWEFITCSNENELEKALCDRVNYNIIIMDLSFKNGLDMAKVLRKNDPTSYMILIASKNQIPTEYVRHDVLAAGLVIRPLSARSLAEALDENIPAYLSRFYDDTSDSNFILDNKEGRQLIPYKTISYFEAMDKKILLFTEKEQYSFYDTLDNLEKRLSDDFVRCHRSFIARKDKINKIMLSKGILTLTSGEMIPVSRTYKATVKELR